MAFKQKTCVKRMRSCKRKLRRLRSGVCGHCGKPARNKLSEAFFACDEYAYEQQQNAYEVYQHEMSGYWGP